MILKPKNQISQALTCGHDETAALFKPLCVENTVSTTATIK
jgi:hypothetical protein